MKYKKNENRIFTSTKKHSKTKRLVVIIELFVLLAVVVGTVITFFRPDDLSIQGFFGAVEERFSLKKPETQIQTEDFESSIRKSIDGQILHIKSVKQIPEGFYSVETSEGTKLIIDPNKDLKDQTRALQTVLSKAKIDKKKPILIDFRFEKLVVRYDR